jgi:hypothetical protein
MEDSKGHKFDTLPTPRQGVRTPAEVRNLAYQLWAFECGRNCRAVADTLGIGAHNVERWAAKEGWAERAERDLRAIMPELVAQSAVNLRLAAYHSSRRLLAIAVAASEGMAPDAKEVDALVKITDRGGFSPLGRDFLPDLPPAHYDASSDLDSLPIEEIIKRHHRALGLPG